MKKSIALLLSVLLLFALTACGEDEAVEVTAEPEAGDAAEPETAGNAVVADAYIQQFLTDEVVAVPAFSAVDREGNAVTEAVFAENTLTMINFWEPWCGPCVGEMPDLERLYEDYKDRGFMILGVHSTEDGAAQVLADSGITYPVIPYQAAFDSFQTGYVPNTIFVDSDGNAISAPVAGSNSYDGWAAVVEYFLG